VIVAGFAFKSNNETYSLLAINSALIGIASDAIKEFFLEPQKERLLIPAG
jgi:hypothetical protein